MVYIINSDLFHSILYPLEVGWVQLFSGPLSSQSIIPGGLWGSRREKGRERKRKGRREKKIKWDKRDIQQMWEHIHLCFKWHWEAHILWVAVRVSEPRSSIPVLCLSPTILHQVCPECALVMHGTDGMKWARLIAAMRMGRAAEFTDWVFLGSGWSPEDQCGYHLHFKSLAKYQRWSSKSELL